MTELSKEQRELMAKLLKEKGLSDNPTPKENSITINPDEINRYEPYPLTDIQQSYLLGRSQKFLLGNVASHAYIEMDIENLDISQYEYAWQKIIERHDMLRTIVNQNGSQQTLKDVPKFRVTTHDLTNLPDKKSKEKALLELRDSLSHQILPTDQWPLFNIHVSNIDNTQYKIHWSFDAIISDVYSNFIFQEELYNYYHQSNSSYVPLKLTFRDYVLTLKNQEETSFYENAKNYWLKKIKTLPSAPMLPLKRDLSEIEKPHFKRLKFTMENTQWKIIKQKSKTYGLTTTSVLLTVFSHILHRWSRNPDFTLNMTVFNRPPWHKEMDKIVGDFTITMLLGIDALSGDNKIFKDLAKNIQSKLFTDLEHRLYSGVNVMQQWSKISGNKQIAPIVFTSALTVGDISSKLDADKNQLGQMTYSITQTPQVLLDHQVYEEDGKLIIHWDYVEEAFEKNLLSIMFDSYINALNLLGKDNTSWEEELSIHMPSLQKELRISYNNTKDEELLNLSNKPIYYSFIEQVKKQATATAIVSTNKTLTYEELAYRAYALNIQLQKRGLGVGDNIAIILPKGWQQVVAVLGVLASGASYIPIDNNSPKQRLNKILKDTNCKYVISIEQCYKSLSLTDEIICLFIEDELAKKDPQAVDFWPIKHTNDDIAYIIYTSGSTGMPKGVMMSHNSVMNTVLDINKRFNINKEDSIFGLSALNFDLSVYDIFGTLAAGATLVLPDAKQEKNPQHWQECLKNHPCTVWNSVPALLQIFLEYAPNKTILESFKTVMVSGDKIPLNLVNIVYEKMPNTHLFSLGGATEAAIWSIYYPIKKLTNNFKNIPYGIPLSNQSIHILDENYRPCPDYAVGKLYIGGIGLSKGYFNDKIKTHKHFIQNPHTKEFLYDTGDLGSFNPSNGGYVEFKGREDNQIKLSGFRIELGEIENNLNEHPNINKAIVVLVEDKSLKKSKQVLVAYIVTNKIIDENKIKQYLNDHLPEYMIPRFYITLDEIPLSINGKIDYKHLPKIDILEKYHANYVAPKNKLETTIQNIISEHLSIEKVSVEESLFDLGATSLDVVTIHNQLETKLNINLSILDLFDKPTIRTLCLHIEQKDNQVNNILTQARQKAKTTSRRQRLIQRQNKIGEENEL
ncbi:non-ribosomal peptide synthetase [Arcobacter sp. F2176]|uniref:non-ribosomal peptide synthetase n=1 Tax=Arcobacter sp. F2176 TaxID=2044511 RepID=UPI00100B9F5D|nr:non-ribosomal peptide synthetase [Arcobacter sp. F2176]RXJ81158.1 non-ribosomal peptide synthetase [Arcobacter sp. F2176]